MFSLIITIISIALVALLAVATLWYGGDAFQQGSSRAQAATLVNQAQQVASAAALFEATEGTRPAYTDIAGGTAYLKTDPVPPVAVDTPQGWSLDDAATAAGSGVEAVVLKATDISDEVCSELNDKGNSVDDATAPTLGAYGCFKVAGTPEFVFRG